MNRFIDDVLIPVLSFLALLVFLCLVTARKAHAESLLSLSRSAVLAQEDFASREYATCFIASSDGVVRASPLIRGENDSFKLVVSLHKGDRIIALFHSHPGSNSSTRQFSAQDVATAKQLNVPSYIYLIKDGVFKQYIPFRNSTDIQRGGDETASGHVVSPEGGV